MKSKSQKAIIEKAAEDMFEETELEGVLNCDKETARKFMRYIWKIAFKRGHIKSMVDNETAIEKENEEIRIEQNHVYENGIKSGVMKP